MSHHSQLYFKPACLCSIPGLVNALGGALVLDPGKPTAMEVAVDVAQSNLGDDEVRIFFARNIMQIKGSLDGNYRINTVSALTHSSLDINARDS